MGLFSRKKKTETETKKSRSAVLTVSNHEQLTDSAARITFDVPAELQAQFDFTPGQYLNLHCPVNGSVVSRSYSICSGKGEPLSVAVKAIKNGVGSNWLVNSLKVGMELEVDFPQGNFGLVTGSKHVAFAAGSGITPMLSMAKSLEGTAQNMQLFYVNSTPESTLFASDLNALKNTTTHYNYSQIALEGAAGHGRFDKQTVSEIIKSDLSVLRADGFYICGPEEMIIGIQEVLMILGVKKENIHFELFTTPVLMKQDEQASTGNFSGTSTVMAMMDGEKVTVQLHTDGKTVLDALDQAGMDVPYSCRGGVCCTCKAKIVEGSARMNINYALTDEEVRDGYVLTCQAHPTSEVLKLDFDA